MKFRIKYLIEDPEISFFYDSSEINKCEIINNGLIEIDVNKNMIILGPLNCLLLEINGNVYYGFDEKYNPILIKKTMQDYRLITVAEVIIRGVIE